MLEDLLIVSGVEVVRSDADHIEVDVQRASGTKCERCWHYRESVGSDAQVPTVCAPCAERLRGVVECFVEIPAFESLGHSGHSLARSFG